MTGHLSDEQLNALADGVSPNGHAQGDADSSGGGSERSDAAASEHLAQCAECRARLAKLRRLLDAAESMPPRVELPVDLWPSIRASIVAQGSAVGGDATPDMRQRIDPPWYSRRGSGVSLAAAAAVLLAVALGTYLMQRQVPGSRSPGSATASVPSSAATRDSAGAVVPASATSAADAEERRVEGELMAALELRRRSLRPSTSAQIDSSLRVIDTAIAELEAARARDPNNAAIRQLLASSRARKVELLKQAQNAS